MSDTLCRQWDPAAADELEALLDDIHGPDRPTQGNGTYRPRIGCECGHAFGDHDVTRCLVAGCDCQSARALAVPLHHQSVEQQVTEALEKERQLLAAPGSDEATYLDPATVWTHDEDGHYAEFHGYHLHVTSDGDVWLNTDVAAFDGLCIGSRLGEGTTEECVADAITTLEAALVRLRAFGKDA